MSIIIFLGVLFVLILVHEWGHYIVAKKTGMRVDEFGIGFPPKIFGIKRGETEYTLNASLIGGFVRIYGEDPTTVKDEDRTRAFGARPKWAQAFVLIAGVTMNVLFAWILFIVIFLGGMPTAVDESNASSDARLVIEAIMPDSPAADVLAPGAMIVQVADSETVLAAPTVSSFSTFIQTRSDTEVYITHESSGVMAVATLTPVTNVLAENPDRAAIGVSLMMVDIYQYSFLESIWRATILTYEMTTSIVVGLTTLLVDAVRGQADLSQVAGPVGIVELVGDAAASGAITLLTFTAFISLNLAVINMLPFPALDGGRLVFVAVEALTGKRISPIWTARLNLFGFALLILLMGIITYNDILRLFS